MSGFGFHVFLQSGTIIVQIAGQNYSAEAFEATSNEELGITCKTSAVIQERIEGLRARMEG